MSVIYLKHPIHGAKVAIVEAEAVYDERSGWVRFNPSTPDTKSVNSMGAAVLQNSAPPEAAPPVPPQAAAQLPSRRRRRVE